MFSFARRSCVFVFYVVYLKCLKCSLLCIDHLFIYKKKYGLFSMQ